MNNNPPASSSCPPHIFFPVDWRIQDVDLSKTTKECRVVGVGKTFDGTSFAAQIAFTPYFFVEIPMGTSQSHRRRLLGDICEKYGAVKAKCTIVERTRLLGFSGGQKAPFLQLTFPSLATFKRARYDLPKNHAFKNFPLYESNVDPLVRFFHVTGIVPASWVGVVASTPVTTEPLTRASIEVITHFRNIKTCPDMDKRIPPLILASWDIECFSADGGFPNADKEGDQIIQIGTTFQQYGQSEPYRRVVVCLGETATPSQESIDIVVCASEADVVNEWIQILQSEDADVMLGYNVNAFDWRYLFGRSNVVVDESTGDTNMHLSSLGKFHEGGGEVDEWELNTSAYGDNKFFALRTGGILQMDLIQILRKEYKLDSYSLNNVSKKFLGDAKVDLAAGTLFKKFQHGTSLDRAEIAVYCSKDCDLPLRLLEKLTLLENLMEMANACTVPMPYIINRGQNVKVASLVLKKARSMGFLCPDIDKKSLPDDVKFDGATVLNAERGAYFDCVSGLDFASLYPSIIRAHNMCYSTIVLDEKYDNLPQVTYYEIETGFGSYRFAQGFPAVLPTLLEELAVFRKDARKKQAEAKDRGDVFAAALFNGQQMAYKISANSVYGVLGATRSFLPCVRIAAAVTATGRAMIARTKELVMQWNPGARVVYGDSVASYTPVYIRHNGVLDICCIDQVAEIYGGGRWIECVDVGRQKKQVCQLSGDVETWSDEGWTTLDRIIRHELPSHKKILRVLTHTGLVDVTDDHSLLDADGRCVRSNEVHVGMALLHHPLPDATNAVTSVSEDEARIMGFFMGDGSCGVYDKSSWALNNASMAVMDIYVALCRRVYPEFEWNVLDTIHNSHVYKLCPSKGICGSLKAFIQKYRTLMYSENCKVIPGCVLNGTENIRRAFWTGLYDADGDKGIGCNRRDQENQISQAHITWLGHSLGFNVSLNSRTDPNQIKKITECVGVSGYVYDLTTRNHHFAAGVGTLIVHNTDSVFVIFKTPEECRHDIAFHFDLAQRAAAFITRHFKPPIELEAEKVCLPFILYAKKRYIALVFEDAHKPGKQDAKGISLVRRDNCQLVKEVSQSVVDCLLKKRDAGEAVRVARSHILRILQDQEPVEKYVVTKALRSGYKDEKQPHLAVARKIHARTGTPVPSGERVPYVFVLDGSTDVDALQYLKAEDPDYATLHKLPLDVLYYIDNQITKPLVSLLEVVVEDPIKELFQKDDTIVSLLDTLRIQRKEEVKVAKRIRKNTANNQQEITSFFTLK